ncbi:MAG: hypothetical protein ABDH63_00100 [Candidatus Caldarchaeales archaeon]
MRWRALVQLGEDVRSFSYPRGDFGYASRVEADLKALGVEEVAVSEEGKPLMLGKGFRNAVFLVRRGGEALAAKVRRDDWPHDDVWREASVHGAANAVGVGPRLRGSAGRVLLMEVVEGIRLVDWLPSASGEEVVGVLGSLFRQCRALDAAGIDHGELGDPSKHVVITRGSSVVIIDFGSARFTTRPKNVTSIAGFISKGLAREALLRAGLKPSVEPEVLRRYKRTLSEEDFLAVLGSIGLERGG